MDSHITLLGLTSSLPAPARCAIFVTKHGKPHNRTENKSYRIILALCKRIIVQSNLFFDIFVWFYELLYASELGSSKQSIKLELKAMENHNLATNMQEQLKAKRLGRKKKRPQHLQTILLAYQSQECNNAPGSYNKLKT